MNLRWKTLQPLKDRDAGFWLWPVAVLLIFASLGYRGLWGAEGRWAEITRAMLRTGDYFHPTIGSEPYFDKPLLTYWLIAIVSWVTGALNEFITRIPSAVAGLIALWATVRLGTRLWSARVGNLAGWLLLATYAFLFWSRTATAETENLAAIMLAVLWYWTRREHPNFTTFLVFYLIAFVGALTKGLTAVAVPVCMVLPDVIREKRWRVLLKPAHFAALALAVGVYLAPFAIASLTRPQTYQSSGLALVFQENFLRYFQAIDHKGAFYIYVYELPILLLPWAPLFVAALISLIRHWRDLDDQTRWLIKAIGLVFVFFSLSGSRRSYYILPAVPLCVLLTAVYIRNIFAVRADVPGAWAIRIQIGLVGTLLGFEFLGPPAALVLGRIRDFQVPPLVLAATLAIALATVGLGMLIWRRTARAVLPVYLCVGAALMMLGGYFVVQQPMLERYRTERPFVRELKRYSVDLAPEQLAIFPKADPRLFFYLQPDRPISILRTADDIQAFMAKHPRGVIITQNRHRDRIPADVLTMLETRGCLNEVIQPWESDSAWEEKWVTWFLDQPAESQEVTISKGTTDHAS